MLARAPGPSERKKSGYRAEAKRMLTRGVEPETVERLRDAVAIGRAEFVLAVKRVLAERDLSGVAGKRELRRRVDVAEVRRAVEEIKGEPWSDFGHRRGDWGCALFLWAARRLCGLTLRELGEAVGGIAAPAVHKLIHRFEAAAAQDAELRRLQHQVLQMSNVEP